MAGDWIKMRAELWTHPRFLSLCSHLVYDDKIPGMLLYACGEDTLGIGAFPPSNETVTERALRCVTRPALRDVTMCALLRVWCSINSHCKVSERDAICCPMLLQDLDEVAGFDGFGEALARVGWVVDGGRNSLTFPNFLEFNEPACLRQRPKTGAERARDHRKRKSDNEERVTRVTKRNAREEKRREDSNNPLISPSKHIAEAAQRVVKHYQATVKPKHPAAGGAKNVSVLLNGGLTEEQLVNAANGYAAWCAGNAKEPQYRLAVRNFYGQAAGYQEYLDWAPTKTSAEMTPEEREARRREWENRPYQPG